MINRLTVCRALVFSRSQIFKGPADHCIKGSAVGDVIMTSVRARAAERITSALIARRNIVRG